MSTDSENGTPSQDPINPDQNRWLQDESGRPSATGRKVAPRPQSAHLQALAARLGADPEALAERIPADTLRRMKYPMLEQVEPDGTRTYKHDVGIIRDGRRVLLATDHSSEPIKPNAPTKPRASDGKFTK